MLIRLDINEATGDGISPKGSRILPRIGRLQKDGDRPSALMSVSICRKSVVAQEENVLSSSELYLLSTNSGNLRESGGGGGGTCGVRATSSWSVWLSHTVSCTSCFQIDPPSNRHYSSSQSSNPYQPFSPIQDLSV